METIRKCGAAILIDKFYKRHYYHIINSFDEQLPRSNPYVFAAGKVMTLLRVVLFDPENRLSEEITKYDFWQILKDVVFMGRKNLLQIEQELNSGGVDVVLAVSDIMGLVQNEFLTKISSDYSETALIVISDDDSYRAVRRTFIAGAFDYLIFDNLETDLKKAIISVSGRQIDAYFSEKIYDKIKVLASHIFNGGDDVAELVDDMVETIYSDWSGNDISCQQVIERVKAESYKLFVHRKPWLEKFIYRGDYILGIGFELKGRDENKKQLCRYYSDINMLFKKYNVIDVNNTIYRIGKSVINNIDDKVSLDYVAKDVYMNKTYISHIFKKMTGISFNAFLMDVKIERAKILLHYMDMSISNIAEMLNFCNISYFGSVFKKHTNYTPSEYRELLRTMH